MPHLHYMSQAMFGPSGNVWLDLRERIHAVDHRWPLSHVAQWSRFNCPSLKLRGLTKWNVDVLGGLQPSEGGDNGTTIVYPRKNKMTSVFIVNNLSWKWLQSNRRASEGLDEISCPSIHTREPRCYSWSSYCSSESLHQLISSVFPESTVLVELPINLSQKYSHSCFCVSGSGGWSAY